MSSGDLTFYDYVMQLACAAPQDVPEVRCSPQCTFPYCSIYNCKIFRFKKAEVPKTKKKDLSVPWISDLLLLIFLN